jgi:hypothetical protein
MASFDSLENRRLTSPSRAFATRSRSTRVRDLARSRARAGRGRGVARHGVAFAESATAMSWRE